MSEQKRSFWARIFGSGESAQEQRALEYIVHRINEDGRLEDIVEEEYVRRTLSPEQIDDIVSNPRIVEAAHERMHEAFNSGELEPNPRRE